MPSDSDQNNALQQRVSSLVRQSVREMKAYQVPDASGMMKLDAMENPYQLFDDAHAAACEVAGKAITSAAVNRYPDSRASELQEKIRQVVGIDSRYDILFGNGSDEIIQMLIQVVATDQAVVMAPSPGFVMYRVLSDINRVKFASVPLKKDFTLDMDAMLASIAEINPALIFLAWPNNPTGNLWALEDIEKIITESSGLVVLDEAYTAFTEADGLPLLDRYPNLLVMRTFSKVGLAGLRLGYLVGRPEWIEQVDKVRMPYNVNVLTQKLVSIALENYQELESQAEVIVEARQQLFESLQEMKGVEVFPSQTNFLLFKVIDRKPEEVHEALKASGVLIKNLSSADPLLTGCLRVSVGLPEENETFLAVLKQVV